MDTSFYSDDEHLPPFFTPTYLRSSRHVLRLRTAHSRRLQEIRAQLSLHPKPPALSTQSSITNLSSKLPPPASRTPALADTVHERLPPPSILDDDASLHPLPTRWNTADSQSGLEILAHGSEVRFAGITKTTDEAASVRADFPMPREVGIYYFEVTILSRHKDSPIGIGFSSEKATLNRLPGWENESWAYHGDDGYVFACTASGKAYGPKFAREDVVGCGVDFRTGEAFFTRNGGYLGVAFTGVKGERLFPSVGMKKPNEHVRVNFGQKPFVFDIDGMVERERRAVLEDIRHVDVKDLHPPDDEESLVRVLVGQYLAHEGYVETKRMFSQEVRERARELGGKGEGSEEEEDDIHAVNRQKIRKAILEGDIDKALKFSGSFYPGVLEEESNSDVWLGLRCRKFVEMIRRAGEIKRGERGFGEDDDEDTQMELDHQLHSTSHREQQAEDRDNDQTMSEEPDPSEPEEEKDDLQASQDSLMSASKTSQMKASQLEQQALAYGAQLQEDFGKDPHPDVQEKLRNCFAVLAYEDWRESPVRGMFEIEGRGEIAEGVNGAVLVSLGKPSSAALEKVCAQTEALLDECAGKDGGMASLVNVERDFLREDEGWGGGGGM